MSQILHNLNCLCSNQMTHTWTRTVSSNSLNQDVLTSRQFSPTWFQYVDRMLSNTSPGCSAIYDFYPLALWTHGNLTSPVIQQELRHIASSMQVEISINSYILPAIVFFIFRYIYSKCIEREWETFMFNNEECILDFDSWSLKKAVPLFTSKKIVSSPVYA
jgi:hypothetical protein